VREKEMFLWGFIFNVGAILRSRVAQLNEIIISKQLV